MSESNYCDYLYNGKRLKIINVGTILELELPDDLLYPNPPISYLFLKKQIEDSFKAHLRSLKDKALTLNCFSRTGYDDNVCFLQSIGTQEEFEYAVFYNMKPYEEDGTCKITITQIARNHSKYPCCNI